MVRCQSCIAKAYCIGYFTGKVSCLPINLRKLQKFFTAKDLQYTTLGAKKQPVPLKFDQYNKYMHRRYRH